MTREEVLNSVKLKKRFCRDCNLPIVLFDNPYFMQRLQTIDRLYHCNSRWNLFCNELENYNNEEEYFAHYNSVKDNAINMLKANPAFQEFMEQEITMPSVDVHNQNLYIEPNDNCIFISIDMKKANFTALKHYSNRIFDGCDTWEDYIGKFTSCKHIINSKYIRQVIFGACNPKRQVTYETSLMKTLIKHIQDEMGDSVDFYSVNVDEIIIAVPNNCGYSLNELKNVIEHAPEGIGQLVRVEMFELCKIGNLGWLKIRYDENQTVLFKCVEAEIFHQVVKHYFDLPITDDDLVFYHNGRLAKFLEAVESPW